jgi:hypothetical protein
MMRKQKGWVILAVALAVLTAAPAAGQEVTICDVQEYDENWGSVLEGQTVTVQGVVTIPPGLFQPLQTSFFIEADGCGVNIFKSTVVNLSVALGDTVEVEGVVTEYNGLTEIKFSGASDITVTGPATGEPEPTYMSLRDIPFERNEGRFLRTLGVVASQSPWYFYIEQPWSGAEIQVYQSNPLIDMGVFDIGDTVDVTGILVQYVTEPPYTGGWELSPRYQSDMKMAVVPPSWPPDPEFWPNAALRIPTQVFRPHGNEVIPIVYLAPDRSAVTMKIYDLQGRVVRTLTEGEYTGYSTIPEFLKDDFFVDGTNGWDGRDDLRRLAPAGAYVCRLEVEDGDGQVTVSTAPIVVGIKLTR